MSVILTIETKIVRIIPALNWITDSDCAFLSNTYFHSLQSALQFPLCPGKLSASGQNVECEARHSPRHHQVHIQFR